MRDYTISLATNEKALTHIREMIDKTGRRGWDTESHGPELESGKFLNVYRSELTGWSIAFPDGTAYYVPMAHHTGNAPYVPARTALSHLLRTDGSVCHNLKHEIHATRQAGLRPSEGKHGDTQVQYWMSDMPTSSGHYGLKALAKHHLGMEMSSFDQVAGKRQFNELTPQEAVEYACEDAIATLELSELADDFDHRPNDEYWNTEIPFVYVLAAMEYRGMAIDAEYLTELRQTLTKRANELKGEWEFLFPEISISSPHQIREHFYPARLWPVKDVDKTAKGLYKVDRRAMELAVEHPQTPKAGRMAAEIRLEYQDIAKLLSTYTTSLLEKAEQHIDGRLHPSYLHTGTRTGRQSCSDPNLQNIPIRTEIGKQIRDAFIAPEGSRLLVADYSQLELRVLAHFAGQGRLYDYFRNPEGDFFDNLAKEIGWDRAQTKTATYATLYGAGDKKIGASLGIGPEGGEKIMYAIREHMPELEAVKDRAVRFAQEHGYVKGLGGMIRRIPEIHSNNRFEKFKAERIALNTPIQGSGAYIMKRAMLAAHRLGLPLIGQVHDELLCEIPEEEEGRLTEELREAMVSAYKLRVPLVAEPSVGDSWAECK
jgi:DNA polymerase-1